MTKFRRLILGRQEQTHIVAATVSVAEYEDRPGEYVVAATTSIPQGPMDDKHFAYRRRVLSLDHINEAIKVLKGTRMGKVIAYTNWLDDVKFTDLLSLPFLHHDKPVPDGGELLVFPDTPRPTFREYREGTWVPPETVPCKVKHRHAPDGLVKETIWCIPDEIKRQVGRGWTGHVNEYIQPEMEPEEPGITAWHIIPVTEGLHNPSTWSVWSKGSEESEGTARFLEIVGNNYGEPMARYLLEL